MTLQHMKILDIPRSGSYAGVTSSHNRAGQYVRNRRTPTNAPTTRRTAIRTAFAAAASGYADLTAAEQLAWIAAAAGHPITDSLGQTITLTGQQLFVSINTALVNAGGTSTTTPPSSFATFDLSGSGATFSVATGLDIEYTTTGTAADFILIGLSKPQSAGISFNKTFSQMQVELGNAASTTITTSAYGAVFGTPVVGNKVFVKLTPVSSLGVTGTALVIPVVVAA